MCIRIFGWDWRFSMNSFAFLLHFVCLKLGVLVTTAQRYLEYHRHFINKQESKQYREKSIIATMHGETNTLKLPANTKAHICIRKIVKITVTITHITPNPLNAPRRTTSITHQYKS
jgi:hypothetical protein